ncbi:hypothetical protein ACN9MF_12940 [Methylobacterium fujisawaense]|uniref:hypothetical protein n=1 Tax=Methylobacterium fujisawaense TaxID=107400 RepID=UPI003CF7D2CF
MSAGQHPVARTWAAPSRIGGARHICLECGRPFAAAVSGAEFCGPACRMVFNNRRARRGAELYDLFMALRHDRATATLFKVWRLLNRLAAIFRDEDRQERDGRKSWRDPATIIARRPYLKAERRAPTRRAG